MFIYKRNKETDKDVLFTTVDEFLADINEVFGDKTKHQQLTALTTLVEGRFYQNLKVAYYIREAVSEFAKEKLDGTRVEPSPHLRCNTWQPNRGRPLRDQRRVCEAARGNPAESSAGGRQWFTLSQVSPGGTCAGPASSGNTCPTTPPDGRTSEYWEGPAWQGE